MLNPRSRLERIVEVERAVALEPNYAMGYVDLGGILTFVGRPQEATGAVKKAMRLNPHYPYYYAQVLGSSYYLAGQFEEAIASYKEALAHNTDHWGVRIGLAGVYGELGREAEAQAEVVEVLRLNPKFSLDVFKQMLPFKDPMILDRYLDALHKAGLG